jgi:hypothetical protein
MVRRDPTILERPDKETSRPRIPGFYLHRSHPVILFGGNTAIMKLGAYKTHGCAQGQERRTKVPGQPQQ